MKATEHYRDGLGAVTTYELEWERRRLSGALCGEDLAGMTSDVRTLLEDQLRAVKAEQAERAASRAAGGPAPGPGVG